MICKFCFDSLNIYVDCLDENMFCCRKCSTKFWLRNGKLNSYEIITFKNNSWYYMYFNYAGSYTNISKNTNHILHLPYILEVNQTNLSIIINKIEKLVLFR